MKSETGAKLTFFCLMPLFSPFLSAAERKRRKKLHNLFSTIENVSLKKYWERENRKLKKFPHISRKIRLFFFCQCTRNEHTYIKLWTDNWAIEFRLHPIEIIPFHSCHRRNENVQCECYCITLWHKYCIPFEKKCLRKFLWLKIFICSNIYVWR